MAAPLSIPQTFASFEETWSPRLVASVNDQEVKIAKIDGAFIWHSHRDTDELFYLLAGELTMEMEMEAKTPEEVEATRVQAVVMEVGDVLVVPKGVQHRPVAKNAHIMMVEKRGESNTGDMTGKSDRTRAPLDVRT